MHILFFYQVMEWCGAGYIGFLQSYQINGRIREAIQNLHEVILIHIGVTQNVLTY